MTSQASGSSLNHPSFAKIVAMSAPSKPQVTGVDPGESENQMNADFDASRASQPSIIPLPDQPGLGDQHDAPLNAYIQGIEDGVERLSVHEKHESEFSQSSGEGRDTGVLERKTSFDDDQTHLSNSSTKPTSFDSKSMASVTTFAMDEKDSLRPDDSASVQAADEEDSLSGPASGAPNSLIGSEAGVRIFRDPIKDGIAQRNRGLLPVSIQRFPDGDIGISGAIPPDSVANNFIVNSNRPDFEPGKSLNGYPLDPDEKLLEAMDSPKDRLFLLQLEEKIRNFIQDSKEQSLELPPSHAFGRLLAHKLGDYYHLTHFVDNNVTSVRLHRTPFCRLPTPLSLLRPVQSLNTPPPNAPAMKIMRRNDQSGDRSLAGDATTASSSAPSKPVSEAGGDGGNYEDRGGSSAGATPAKDRSAMTREEREAKYQEARERIFRDFPESKPGDLPSGDSSADVSRSSSTSGRKKNFRQRTPHDDSFEARSQFNAYYPGMSYTASTMPMPMQNGTNYGQQHPYMVGPGAPLPNMNYPQGTPTSNVYPNNVSQYPMNTVHMGQTHTWQGPPAPQQSPYQGYVTLSQPSPMMGQQAQTGSSPAMNNYAIPNTAPFVPNSPPSWSGQPYQNNYVQSTQRNASMNWQNYPSHSMAANTNPYPYGQVPNQHYSTPAQNQNTHSIISNFNRSAFNPQTRSFVPTGNSATGRYNPKGVGQTANVAYNNTQVNGQRQQWSGHMESNGQPMTYVVPHTNIRANGNATNPNPMPRVAQPGSNNSIAKWGTPAHLPPKPPSKMPTEFETKSRDLPLPANSFPNTGASTGGPLVVSGGSNVSKSNLD